MPVIPGSNVGFAILVAAALSLAGCAQFRGTCSWVVPEAGAALQTVEVRKPIPGECNCATCGAPGRFLIQRNGYTLELWNGDRWYAELYLRARTDDGAILSLSSEPPALLRMAPHMPAEATRGFEYFIRMEPDPGQEPVRQLSISVVHPDGRVLGVENVGLRVEGRQHMNVEFP